MDDLEEEIRACSARLIWRRAEQKAENRRQVAYHEAGHAAACTDAGIPFQLASIGTEDASTQPTLGRVVLSGPEPVDRFAVEAYVIMLFVGPAAERRHGNAFPASDLDNAHAVRLAQSLGFSDRARERFLALCVDLADDFARDSWPWISRVAEALLAHGRLTPADVLALRDVPLEAVA